jgi:tagatose-1,6-bisphosphate aldolase non-catalytic subunit AgaZ/GatZ
MRIGIHVAPPGRAANAIDELIGTAREAARRTLALLSHLATAG